VLDFYFSFLFSKVLFGQHDNAHWSFRFPEQRLAIMKDICKKKNASIMRLKEDMIAMEEKVNDFTLPSTSVMSVLVISLFFRLYSNFPSLMLFLKSEDL